MASFTDKSINFNPYVQQLPVEAMTAVGSELQRRYDEGVQKIQYSIDRIAGLDIIKDPDKQHLQSKLNELGGKLRTVAAGDFSNYQLVTSTASLAGEIGNDPLVQEAVISTARYKKELSNIETARKEGKSAIQNEWDFSEKAGKWLNDNTAGSAFNDRYSQFIDVDKKWLEVLKNLHSDLKEEDIPYVTKQDGTIDYTKTLAAMERVSTEKLSAEKIENALRASLSPDELNQLAINGRFQFKGYETPEELSVYSNTRFSSQIERNNAAIKELEGFATLSSSDPESQKTALDTIDQIKKKNISLEQDLKDELAYIREDPDGAKAMIYKNGAITEFAVAHSWEHSKKNLLTNPVLEADHWNQKYALDLAQFKEVQAEHAWQRSVDKFNMQVKGTELQLAIEKQNRELYGGGEGAPETYLGESTHIKDPMTAMANDERDLKTRANTAVEDMVSKMNGVSVGQVEEAIKRYNGGDPEWYKANGKTIIPREYRGVVNDIIDDRAKAKRLSLTRDHIRNEAMTPAKKQEINKIITAAQVTPVTFVVTTPLGGKQKITMSPLEIANYYKKQAIAASNDSPKELTLKEMNLNSWILTTFEGRRFNNKYGASLVSPLKYVYEGIDDAVNEKALQLSGTYIPRVGGISFGSDKGDIARRKMETLFTNALMRYDKDLNKTPGGAETLSKSDIKNARNWMSGKGRENLIYKKVTQGDKTFGLVINGSEEIMIPLTPDEASFLPADKNEPSARYKDVYATQNAFNGATNPTGKYEDAYFGRSYFKNTTLDVKADMQWDMKNTADQYLTLKLNTPIGVLPLQLEDYPEMGIKGSVMPRDGALEFIEGLTNSEIKQLYLQSETVPESWKNIIKQLK